MKSNRPPVALTTLICIITAVILFIACNSGGSSFYSSKNRHFSIKFPENWINEEIDEYSVVATTPEIYTDVFYYEAIVVTYEKLDAPITVEALRDSINIYTSLELANYKVREKGKVIIDGRDCVWETYRFTTAEGPMMGYTVYLVEGLDSYIIDCSSDENRFSEFLQLFKQVVGTFKCI